MSLINQILLFNELKEIHRDKYDYTLVRYKNMTTKVKIVCPVHGVFEQTLGNHKQGKGCSKCSNRYKMTTEEYIVEAIKIHGDRYDYSLVVYTSKNSKIKIICPIHGIFEQIAKVHLNDHNCPKCANRNRKSTEQFIIDAVLIHGDRYDYSLVNYKNNRSKIKIICPIHSVFEQTPTSHLKNRGCLECSYDIKKMTKSEFIKKSIKIHGNKYDYSLVNYINNRNVIKIICPIHGEFLSTPSNHLMGSNCKKCFHQMNTSNTFDFIKKATIIHGNIYDYSLVNYINNKTKVIIICPVHGEFYMTPNHHLNGSRCTHCNMSRGEEKINLILINKNIHFENQKKFDGCVDKKQLPFDFYLPELNLCIEFDGEQHFRQIEFFGGEEKFKIIKKHDKIKNKYCKENNINLLRISFKEINNIENIINKL